MHRKQTLVSAVKERLTDRKRAQPKPDHECNIPGGGGNFSLLVLGRLFYFTEGILITGLGS
jgi:hypothetical protein